MSVQLAFYHSVSRTKRCTALPIRFVRKAFYVLTAMWALTHCAPSTPTYADEAQLLKQTCNGTTIAVLRVNSKELSVPAALSQNASSIAVPIAQIRELLQGQAAYFAIDLPYSLQVNARLHASTSVPEQQLASLAKVVWPFESGNAQTNAGWRTVPLAMSKEDSSTIQPNSELFPTQLEAWQLAMRETDAFPVQLVIVYPKYLRDTFKEIDPALPAMLGGGSASPFIAGVQWTSLGLKSDTLAMRLVIQTESAETAETIKTSLPKITAALLQEGQLDQATSTLLKAAFGLLQPEVRGQQLVFSMQDPERTAIMLQLITSAMAAVAQPLSTSQTQDQLKQLGLGIHNFVDVHRMLPTYDWLKKHEKPSGLSWRVHLLPYVGEVELYNQFKLDEPWDSAHNIKLLEKMPSIYQPNIPTGSAETVKPFHTTFAAPLGEKTVFGQNKPIGFQHILDGTSNTIVIVELKPEHAIPWTSPEEYRYDKAAPTSKLRSINGRINVALLDGSVHGFRDDVPAATWNALFTIDGGEVVRLP